jgi:hypothetical protein
MEEVGMGVMVMVVGMEGVGVMVRIVDRYPVMAIAVQL